MIDCRNCHHGSVIGAVFCIECGELLGSEEPAIVALIDEHVTEELKKKAPRPQLISPAYSWISLYFIGSGTILPLAPQNEFILGRLTHDSLILPDVDLTPYRANISGVSRIHAIVKRQADRTLVIDLGSSNGTFLNGQRIQPDVEMALSHQDIIGLGTLQIQVLLQDL
jgi:hypothetical protein